MSRRKHSASPVVRIWVEGCSKPLLPLALSRLSVAGAMLQLPSGRKYGMAVQIQLEDGRRVITVRSALQVHNHTDLDLDMYAEVPSVLIQNGSLRLKASGTTDDSIPTSNVSVVIPNIPDQDGTAIVHVGVARSFGNLGIPLDVASVASAIRVRPASGMSSRFPSSCWKSSSSISVLNPSVQNVTCQPNDDASVHLAGKGDASVSIPQSPYRIPSICGSPQTWAAATGSPIDSSVGLDPEEFTKGSAVFAAVPNMPFTF